MRGLFELSLCSGPVTAPELVDAARADVGPAVSVKRFGQEVGTGTGSGRGGSLGDGGGARPKPPVARRWSRPEM